MLCVVKRFGCVFILSADVNKCNKQGSSFIGLAIIRDERPKWTHHWHIRDGYSSATDCITLHTNRLTRLITGLINKDSVMYFIICKRQWSWRWCSGRTCHECVSWSLSTQTFSQHQVWLRLLFLLNYQLIFCHPDSTQTQCCRAIYVLVFICHMSLKHFLSGIQQFITFMIVNLGESDLFKMFDHNV